ncbi:MAG: MotA/TolQ/ExbB proton channel family protein [Prevotellaceae bacterium]|jgi:biopolymer transport protein ExbB|nr:MotA/TolQ/ExbB proton channel family protein [Prevotellaceae bacterium]
MRYKKIKSGIIIGVSMFAMFAMFSTSPVLAQTGKKTGKLEIFSDQLPEGTQWNKNEKFVRKGGYTSGSENYIYLKYSWSPAELTGLSIPVRENPGPGEYRYITFAWIKWGGEHIGIKFGHESSGNPANRTGRKYDYTYAAGKGDSLKNALVISDNIGGRWIAVTRDLWKDFGDFTLTGITFICPAKRDAGFDGIFLGKSPDDFKGAPPILPDEVAPPVDIDGDENMYLDDDSAEQEDQEQIQGVKIDWAAQVKAGGFMMYPLYLLALVAIVIALQRMMTARAGRFAPKKLRTAIDISLKTGNMNAALAACDKYHSILSESLRFIFTHRKARMEIVSQSAGDIASREIRGHLSRIYPLSVIASLSPLLGLLGTIVGMIEAFGLVALYGDEGGAAILSDSISKALITTAAGLIIAVPAIAVYFIIRNRIMHLASLIESEIENVITVLYLNDDSISKDKEEDN